MDKRTFLKGIALGGLAAPFSSKGMNGWVDRLAGADRTAFAGDDDFWMQVRGEYNLKPDYINLESGYYNILPKEILEKYVQHIRDVNYQGSYYMRTVQFDNQKAMAAKVAELAGCSTEELVLTRNTTESLDMIIGGFHWNAGDEAVMAMQDYGAMLEMFKLVAKKQGIVNRLVSIPMHPLSDEEIVAVYANAITTKTRLLMIPHMVNITGQIMPVRKICDMAHAKGVEVMVDGAHAIAHFTFRIDELGCDYYGASLHKWLAVPLGVGLLYVKKEKIAGIWPLFAESERKEDDIARLNHLGTHPVHTHLAVSDSIDFYKRIGPERKEARLRFLQQYWTGKLRDVPNIIINTPSDAHRACGIANVGLKNMAPKLQAETLLKKYKIFTVAIDNAGVRGCRITPNIFTTTAELDRFVEALKEMSV